MIEMVGFILSVKSGLSEWKKVRNKEHELTHESKEVSHGLQ